MYFSFHERDYTRDVESLKDRFQNIDEENFTEDQTLKHFEEVITEVIIGALHQEMMVMLGSE